MLVVADSSPLVALAAAKRTGLIPAVKPLIIAMQTAGIHLSTRLVLDALRLAGE